MLGSSDSNKEEALYSAVMASRASQPISSSDPQRVSLDDVEQADANCGECEASSAATCSKKMRLVQKHSLFVHSVDQVARDEVKRYLSL